MEKIVFVIPDMPGGGTERVVALLANEYSRRSETRKKCLCPNDATVENTAPIALKAHI